MYYISFHTDMIIYVNINLCVVLLMQSNITLLKLKTAISSYFLVYAAVAWFVREYRITQQIDIM